MTNKRRPKLHLAYAWFVVLAVQLFGQQVASSSVQLLDERDPVDVASIANSLCENVASHERQISRVSTIAKLVDYFDLEVSGESHSLFKCKQSHEEALHLLNEVLSVSNENVCSETKLALIEDFHNLYVSTYIDHEQSRKDSQRELAPQLLRLMFIHYAMEVDALCKRNLINNLEWDLKEKFGDDIERKLFELEERDEKASAPFRAIFKGALQKFTDLYSVDKYEDALIVWNLIENSYLSQKSADEAETIRDEFDPITGEPIRLLVKVKARGYLDRIRDHCHYSFKPIYTKLILPIIRLADLGYANSGEQFRIELEELRSNEHVKRWYSVTQLCEAMLPIKYYEDEALEPNDVVVITKSEAASLEQLAAGRADASQASRPSALQYEPQTNSMVGLDRLESVSSMDVQKLVKEVKLNLSQRERVVGRAIVQLLRNLKSQFKKSRIGRFFFSKAHGNSSGELAQPGQIRKGPPDEREEVGQKLSKSLEKLDEMDLLKMEGAVSSTRVIKSKRDASGIGRRRRYRRKGDVDTIQEMRSEALSYSRTKSWSEIFAGWGEVFVALKPSRTKLVIVGSVIVTVLILVVMCSIISMMTVG